MIEFYPEPSDDPSSAWTFMGTSILTNEPAEAVTFFKSPSLEKLDNYLEKLCLLVVSFKLNLCFLIRVYRSFFRMKSAVQLTRKAINSSKLSASCLPPNWPFYISSLRELVMLCRARKNTLAMSWNTGKYLAGVFSAGAFLAEFFFIDLVEA
eukprot:CAMPEP_0170512926 /NCGR_PEP_ID=MMETSP0208-20121228/67122_1 /TAXON_ID=197538 /ORGANISM="Strombidium inclinatum, Strain S3" /LENGTH=151 /DNA_ID=CAMNT_0010796607 /DNA_START=159 /DNA_END=614 /DNA_ORIENTATION=-